MSLICQHGLTVDKSLVIILIMQSGSCWPTATDREVWFDSASVESLLSMEVEETLELAFPHARLAVFHHIAMSLGCDLACPSHGEDFFIVLDSACLS